MGQQWMMGLAMTALLVLAGCTGKAERSATQADAPPVPQRAEDVQPRDVGEPAPTAVLRSAGDQPVDLAERYRDRPTMLLFYRGGWCPYCNQQLGQLGEADEAITGMGIQIIAISPDRPAKLRENPIEGEQSYQLLSDSGMTLTRAFGLAFRVDDETLEQYDEFGIDLADAAGEAHHLLPVPAVYLIDRDGVIRFAHWDADYSERLTADVLIDAARAIAP